MNFKKQAKAIVTLLKMQGNISVKGSWATCSYDIISLETIIDDRYLILKSKIVEDKEPYDETPIRFINYDAIMGRIVCVFIPYRLEKYPNKLSIINSIKRYELLDEKEYIALFENI